MWWLRQPKAMCTSRKDGSRRHALVVVNPDEILVIDCESKNGTRVDGEKVRSAVVDVGARIRFGLSAWELEHVHPDDPAWALSRRVPTRTVPSG